MKPPRRMNIESDPKQNEHSLNIIFQDIYKRFGDAPRGVSLPEISRIVMGDGGVMKEVISSGGVGGGTIISSNSILSTQPTTPTIIDQVTTSEPISTKRRRFWEKRR